MRLLLAVSADGYLARGPDDDMRWTGPLDKAAFRLLTLSDEEVLLAGSRTFDQMPPLPGRTMLRLSREDRPYGKHKRLDLDVAAQCHPNAWLIGGPTVAEEALRRGMIDRAFICVSPAMLHSGMPFSPLDRLLPKASATIRAGDVRVLVFSRTAEWPAR